MFQSMTLFDLEQLCKSARNHSYDSDTMVTFASDYGDLSHTQVVHELEGSYEERAIDQSAYGKSGYALVDEADDFEANGELQKVLVIS